MDNYAFDILGIRKLVLLFVNNDYGKGLEEVIEKEFKGKGGQIVEKQSFEQKETDFRNQLSKIKKSNANALYIISYPEEIIRILKQIKELGINIKLLATSAFQDAKILENAGQLAEGVIYPYPINPYPNDSSVSNFLDKYEKKYRKKPGIVCDTGYDALNMIASAIISQKTFSGDEIQKGLSKIKNYPGASGIISFDVNGDIEKEMKMRMVKNGKFVDIN